MMKEETSSDIGVVWQAMRTPARFLMALIVLHIAWSMCTAAVPAGHVALLYRWGKLDPSVVHKPGLMYKLPWPIQSVEYYPTRLDIALQKGEVADSKQQLIDAEISVQLVINPDKAPELRQGVGTWPTVVKIAIDNNILQATKSETTLKPVQRLVTERSQLVSQIKAHLQRLVDATLAEKGIENAVTVVQVGINRFDFKPGFVKSIDDMVVSAQVAYTENIKKQVKTILADANGQKTEIVGKARAYRTGVVGAAQAYAIEILGEAAKANSDLRVYEAIEAWNKKVPNISIGGGGANLLITAPQATTDGR
ncbi:MAG TPA: SPFH domain-containing protein [Candidatus Obscuribacterales bacterium]